MSGLTVSRRLVSAVWGGYAASGASGNASGPSGRVQPRATVPVPRRYPSRAAWRSAAGTANAHGGNGTIQPRGTIPVPRRKAARAAWRGQSTPQPHLPGQSQPRATIQPSRRYPARAAWRGTVVVTVNTVPPGVAGQQPHGFTSSRRPVGGFWGGTYTPQPNASGPAGAIQPRAAIPVPRRVAARVLWRGPAAVVTVNNTPQGPAGTVQPRAAVAVPRRTAARAAWQRALGAINARGPSGAVQPKPVIGRRSSARAFTRGTPPVTSNAAPAPPASGTVQPAATAPHRPHAAQRVIWRGNAVPGTPPQPVAGGLVKRRAAARGLWHGNAGSPPQATLATPVTGGTVRRRPPARGQWHGVTPSASNARGPAVGPPKRRPDIPRRPSARVAWNGTIVSTTNNHGIPGLWSTGSARLTWTTGRARLTWTTGRARNG